DGVEWRDRAEAIEEQIEVALARGGGEDGDLALLLLAGGSGGALVPPEVADDARVEQIRAGRQRDQHNQPNPPMALGGTLGGIIDLASHWRRPRRRLVGGGQRLHTARRRCRWQLLLLTRWLLLLRRAAISLGHLRLFD